MDIKNFISKFDNHPILFMGTGMSKRYCEQSFTWEELLREISRIIYGNDDEYYKISYRLDDDLLKIAGFLETAFDNYCLDQNPTNVDAILEKFYEVRRKGVKYSPFKIFIAEQFKNYTLSKSMEHEFMLLKEASKNICSIITTNYDGLIEGELPFKPLIGNDILLSNPFGSVYKVHGCYTKPDSLIITEEDYKRFDQQYELIRAELVSLFIHHPIIFMGYGFRDENIQKIVETIFKYVDPNSSEAGRIRDNFLVVEYKKGLEEANVEDYVVRCEKDNIRLNKVSTDSFGKIYSAISALKLRASVMDVRRIQNLMYQVAEGKRAVSVDVRLEDDIDGQVTIGTTYTNLTATDFKKRYFDFMTKRNPNVIKIVNDLKIQQNIYFPVFGFIDVVPGLAVKTKLEAQQLAKIRELLRITSKQANANNSIVDVLGDVNIPSSSKHRAILYCALHSQLVIEDIEQYLKNIDHSSTNYNQLLVVYDYLKYCPEDMKI